MISLRASGQAGRLRAARHFKPEFVHETYFGATVNGNIFNPGDQWEELRERGNVPSYTSGFLLSELARDWHFFSHGSLFAFAGMQFPHEDPVADWYKSQPRDTKVLRQPFKHAIFQGLDAPTDIPNLTWNHVLCGVRRHNWQSIWQFLGGVATVDQRKGVFCQTFSGNCQILDPVAVEGRGLLHPDLPKITVTVICVESNKDRWEVRPSAAHGAPLRFVRVEPRQNVKDMAKAVLSGELEELKHKYNPAFQPFLDKYKAITGGNQTDATNGDRGRLGPQGRRG